jgi:hypothetical protein
MLGALLGVTPGLPRSHVVAALQHQIANPRLLALDEAALDLGMKLTQGLAL